LPVFLPAHLPAFLAFEQVPVRRLTACSIACLPAFLPNCLACAVQLPIERFERSEAIANPGNPQLSDSNGVRSSIGRPARRAVEAVAVAVESVDPVEAVDAGAAPRPEPLGMPVPVGGALERKMPLERPAPRDRFEGSEVITNPGNSSLCLALLVPLILLVNPALACAPSERLAP
jgi:hypothetical protein